MALLTISGDPASRWEEIAHGAARLLGFELVTESRLASWLIEEFGASAIPEKAWKFAALSVLARLASEHHLVIAIDAAELLFEASAAPIEGLLRAHVAAPLAIRIGNVMLDGRLEKTSAAERLARLDLESKRLRKQRFGRLSPAAYDVTLSMRNLDTAHASEILAAAAHKLTPHGFLSVSARDAIAFETRLQLARHGIAPAGVASVKPAAFNHSSEQMFANLLDFYRIQWDYEPRSFPLQWDKDGNVTEAFTPDFYLPQFDLYVELTTMKQSLVTRKNRKVKLLRAIYPHVNIQVFYQKDFQDLVFKYGWKAS